MQKSLIWTVIGRSKIQVTFLQVKVQVIMIQINEQHKVSPSPNLLTLSLLDRGESVWFGNLS